MNFGISVNVDPSQLSAIQAMLGALRLEDDQRVALNTKIANAILTQVQLRFVDGGFDDAAPWIPSIRAQAQSGQTMRDTGTLMNSFTSNVDADGLEVGTNVPYAPALQFGATITAKTGPVSKKGTGPFLKFMVGDQWVSKQTVYIPARPMLGLDDANINEIQGIVANFLAKAGK